MRDANCPWKSHPEKESSMCANYAIPEAESREAQTQYAKSLLGGINPYGHAGFIPLAIAEIELHSVKNKDYARGGDPLGNFKRVADQMTGLGVKYTPAQVAFIYMAKQYDAAGRMLFGGYEGETEGLADRLRDVAVYAKLIQLLKAEEHVDACLPKGEVI